MNTPDAVERVAGTDGKSYPSSYSAHRDAIRAAIQADPSATNTVIANRMKSSRDTVIAVRRELAGALVDARYEAMCVAIAECYRTDEVKDLRDKALALQVYTRQAKNREAEQRATEIRLRAERRAGELLLKQAKAEGTRGQLVGRGVIGGANMEPPIKDQPTLADQGVSKRQASDWQKIATLSEEQFEHAIRDPERSVSTASMVKLAESTMRANVHRTEEVPTEQGALFNAGLQPRYPVERDARTEYVKRALLTLAERRYNAALLRQEGEAKVAHGSALDAETDQLIEEKYFNAQGVPHCAATSTTGA
ncbi:hypothetical protein F6X37_11025 [Paraburkholderia sp. 31.1]|uniref:hypothetical protein n=1 Tax=Paraburkholderia sp. 31.1 TaxID=2615205 RepID=UPI0016550E24|nr:hypothetical protein [Paraburkholderia sp. 31.1]MBC8722106.1 hypothetical protein [Paraburkholderia sp. 31.1]